MFLAGGDTAKRLAWPWGGGHHDCWLRPHPNENQRALSVDQPTMYLDLCWSEAVWMVWPPLLRDYLIYALIPWCCSFITSCYHSHYHINMHRHTHLHPTHTYIYIYTGWWFGTFVFLHILGMSSSQLTNIFQRGWNHQPDIYIYIFIHINYYMFGAIIHSHPFLQLPGIAAGHTSFRLVGVKDPPWHRVPWVQWPGAEHGDFSMV